MGALLAKAFIPPDDILGCTVDMTGVEEGEEGKLVCLAPFSEADWYWGFLQVGTLMAVYGSVLFYASNTLANGSELLLLVPSLAGIVGSVVLPILGAVPDGAIMLFSGLGPNAQEQLTVGIGTIAGSTIMLLTIPWGFSIILGKVPIGNDGEAVYSRRRAGAMPKGSLLSGAGVTPDASIRNNAMLMVLTSLIYLVIQGPAFPYSENGDASILPKVAREEHTYALIGLVVAVVAFIGYIVLMMRSDEPAKEFVVNMAQIRAIEDSSGDLGHVTLVGILAPIIAHSTKVAAERGSDASFMSGRGMETLLDDRGKRRLGALLKPFLRKYDKDNDGKISPYELRLILRDLGEPCSADEATQWMQRLDPDRSGQIEADQFTDAMLNYIMEKAKLQSNVVSGTSSHAPIRGGQARASHTPDPEEEEEEEEEEMPADLQQLSPEEQQKMIKLRAAKLMFIGLALILVFSDPMVDVMSNVGARLGVPPFYVSFILAPLASNASELIASLNYAAKKTKKTITVSLSALEGAACMNNTFCLAIFMALIYFKQLAWKFTAETLAILIVELCIALIALNRTQRVWHACLALTLFPLSLLFVATLEAHGFD